MRATLAAALAAAAVLLAASGMGASDAQTSPIARHVVINEIDVNPAGPDDAQAIEWVELYNPTSYPVDIGGWQIASSVVSHKELILPHGTLLPSGQFAVFTYSTSWFPDRSSLVQLRNIDGVTIDQTPLLTDVADDGYAWHRIFDAYDTNSNDDWEFSPPSRGTSNGKHGEDTAVPSSVSVWTAAPQYEFGQIAEIRGNVSSLLPVPITYQVTPVILTVKGTDYSSTTMLHPDGNLEFASDLHLQPVLGFATGKYVVTAQYGESRAHAEFDLDIPYVQEERAPKPVLLIEPGPGPYKAGQTVTLAANTTAVQEYAGLKYEVAGPAGGLFAAGTAYPDKEGSFLARVYLPTTSTDPGTYLVAAEYAGQQASASFVVISQNKSSESIVTSFDRAAYGLGDTVVLSGRLSSSWTPSVDVGVLQARPVSEGLDAGNILQEKTAVRVQGDGAFEYRLKIHDNKDRLGEYQVTLSTESLRKEIFFYVAEDPATYVPLDAEPFTLRADRQSYMIGQNFEFSGKVDPTELGESDHVGVIAIIIRHSDGRLLTTSANDGDVRTEDAPVAYRLIAVPDIVGNYHVDGKIYRSAFEPGSYTAQATYDHGHLRASAQFVVTDPLAIGSDYDVDISSESVGLNSDVTVRITAPGLPQGTPITVLLHKPDGGVDRFGTLADESVFEWQWRTPVSAKSGVFSGGKYLSNYGTYLAAFSVGSERIDVRFEVSDSPSGGARQESPLTVSTDRSSYFEGHDIKVSGTASLTAAPAAGGADVPRVEVALHKKGLPQPIEQYMVYPDTYGAYSTTFVYAGSALDTGLYEARASYKGQKASADFSVGIAAPPASEGPARLTQKFSGEQVSEVPIDVMTVESEGATLHPRVLQGSLYSPPGEENRTSVSLYAPGGQCIIGTDDGCAVSGLTIGQGRIYEAVTAGQTDYLVRYSGTDARLERFAVVPADPDAAFAAGQWKAVIEQDGQSARFYYQITHVR